MVAGKLYIRQQPNNSAAKPGYKKQLLFYTVALYTSDLSQRKQFEMPLNYKEALAEALFSLVQLLRFAQGRLELGSEAAIRIRAAYLLIEDLEDAV